MNFLREAIKDALEKSLVYEASKKTDNTGDAFMRQAKKDAYNTTVDSFENGDNEDARKHMERVGQYIGVNMPSMKSTEADYSKEKNVANVLKEKLSKDIIKAASVLTMLTSENGNIPHKHLFPPSLDDHRSSKGYGKLNGEVTKADDIFNYSSDENQAYNEKTIANDSHLMKMKDLIDKLNLTFLYDQSRSVLKSSTKLYNLDLSVIRTLVNNVKQAFAEKNKAKIKSAKMQIINYASDNLDLSDVSKEELLTWATEGTKGKIDNPNNMFNRIEMFDANGNKLTGEEWKKAIDGREDKKQELLKMKYQAIIDSYMTHVYGIDFEMPNSPFTQGNAKLPSTSLVINFTSAHGCPSWNECLVKHACYARTSEQGYKNLWRKNDNLQMMWEGSKYDRKIKKSLRQMIRFYCISITRIASAFNKAKDENGKTFLENFLDRYHGGTSDEYGENFTNVFDNQEKFGNESYWNATKGKKGYNAPSSLFKNTVYTALKNTSNDNGFLSVFNEKERELIRTSSGCLKVTHIRLNEEGDFIGQWLLDDMNEFAEELKSIGVQMVCYTCRFLNYDGIKNIVINASQQGIGSNGGIAMSNDNIERYFFAVSEDFYNSLDETYGTIDDNGNVVEAQCPTLVVGNSYREGLGSYGKIIPMPKPLGNSGKYYYKCPCGRGKVRDLPKKEKGESEEEFQNRVARFKVFHSVDTFNTERKKMNNNEVTSNSAINCYECNVCYCNKEEDIKYGTNLSNGLIVLVQVHSANKEDFASIKGMEKPLTSLDGVDGKSIYNTNFNDVWNTRSSNFGEKLMGNLTNKFTSQKDKQNNESNINNGNMITEGIIDSLANTQDEALSIISDNAINSVHEHFAQISKGLAEGKKIKNNFNETYKRLFG